MDEHIPEMIAEMMLKSSFTVVLTGAGISTESGIPDFRSPGTGLWEKVDPMEALSADVLYKNPKKFYTTGFKILTGMRNARPNKAHEILAKMEAEGLIKAVITQNIDNLHYEAGSKNIMEVHGHIRTGHCIRCKNIYEFDAIEKKVDGGEIPPVCSCGGMIRPDVVLFGDSLPHCFDEAWKMSEKCQLMIVIGSSLQVAPVNYLPTLAKRLVLVNIGETMFDRKADIVYREKASDALDSIYNKIREIKGND